MNQHRENVQNLVTNKMQELHNATEKWKENYERTVQHVCDKQGKLCEPKCQEAQKKENEKAAICQANQERKLKTKANGIESELLRHGDEVRQGIEAAHNEKHLQQIGESLMAELQLQAAGHKSDMHSMANPNRGAGEHNTLPTQEAQHTERKRLRNEMVTEIRNDLGLNSANAEWTKVRNEIDAKMNRATATMNDTTEETGGRLAQCFKFETTITKKIEEIMQNQDDRHERNGK
jgi:hypothetical protein